MEKSLPFSDTLTGVYGLTPLWDSYYRSSQEVKYKNKWEKIKTGWKPRKRRAY